MKIDFSIILILIFAFTAFGQTPSPSATPAQPLAGDDQPIKVSTLLVNIPVIASDRDGRNIAGLTKDNFTITQNGEKQPIEFFADEEAPMNVAIVVDLSGSTSFVLGDIKKAARDFIKLLRPEDKAMIVGFDYEIRKLSELTADQKKLRKAVDQAEISKIGGSDMQDAVYQVVTRELAAVQGRKAIIVLTDGMVWGVTTSNQKLLNTVTESEVLIYPIFFQTTRLFPTEVKTVTFEQLVRVPSVNYLNSLALATGGRLYAAHSSDFKTAFKSIAEELKKQYLVGFYPSELSPGQTRQIKIETDRKDVILRSKRTIRLKTSP